MRYQGYKFAVLDTYLCSTHRLCYCRVVTPLQPNSARLSPRLPGFQEQEEVRGDTVSSSSPYPVTTTSPSPSTTEYPLFAKWVPPPRECACWCRLETAEERYGEPYRSRDTCYIDDTDCYCGSHLDRLWANQFT